MDFALLILLNAVLFLRPADVLPSLSGMPIYNGVILACLAVSFSQVIRQLSTRSMREQPISACVIGLLPAVLLSHLSHFNFAGAVDSVNEFYKVVLYYALIVGVLNTSRRFQQFLDWFCLFIITITVLGILQYYGAIDLPAFAPVDERVIDPQSREVSVVARLCGAGIFANPNDLARILLVGMALCLNRILMSRSGPLRVLWVAPLCLFFYTLALTHSRGAFIALLAGVLALLWARYGRKASFLFLITLPVLIMLFAGRQTDLSTSEGTAQERVQLWGEAYIMIKQSPLFGIGMNQFAEEAHGLAPHNSFMQCYTELGLLGGTLFFGAFFGAIYGVCLTGQNPHSKTDLELLRLRPALLAILASYTVGILSSNRSYNLPTYLLLGLASAYLRLTSGSPPKPILCLDRKFVMQLVLGSMICLVILNVFVRYSMHAQ